MSTDGVDAAAPNLNLTPDEKRLYGQLFRQADTESVGVVTGETAVKFFEKTRLDSRILGEIWQIADKENRGFLTPAGFGLVLRLIGHAQAGREPTPDIALQQGPLPRFDGMPPPASGIASPTPPPAVALQAQGTGGGPIRIPPLTPEKVNQYAGLFERQPLQAGNLLPGDQAKSIFEKSGLPNEVLGRIWQLADTEQRGALVTTEFVIAMHLLTSMKTGALRGLPNVLPAALYEAATRRGPVASRQSPTSTGPISAIPRQLSGSAQFRAASPLGRPPITAQTTGASGNDWLITPADKARFDVLYDDLDKTRKGFITGEEAVPFLSQSNLPEDALAQIWDLSDINSEGRLNRDTFAVAMYLIRQQRSKRDGSTALPAALPPNLIPPSFRSQPRPTTSGSPFDAPPEPQPPAHVPAPAPAAPKSALDDLFGLDTPPGPAPAQVALSTGGSTANDPFGSGSAVLAPSSPIRPSPTGTQFKPFVPSSSFGRGLTAQPTGDSASGRSPAVTASEDLLGDGDPEVSKKLTSETAELANLSNQVGSLSKQMQEVQGQRTTTQNELNQANSQKKNFEQRLAQLRTLYEKEAKDVEALRIQLNASRNETKKLQVECMTLDGTYRDLQTQHQQVLAGLEADQQENAKLKEKIRTVNAEVAQLKPQIEKLKSEARQQKGLVAINKKQLATNESERDKLQSELTDLSKSNEELSRQAHTSSPVTTSAQVASPTPSTASGNNPFFRRTGSTDIMGTFASPPPAKPFGGDKSFDDVFGPAFPPVGPTSTPPPATSFKPQHTGASTASLGSFPTTPVPSSPNASRQATLAAEAPAPPDSKQTSSSFLPFADAAGSLSSSQVVSPPASRTEGSGEVPPADSLPGAFPVEPVATGQSTTSTSTASNSEPVAQGDDKPSGTGAAAAPESTVADVDPFSAMDQNKAKADFEDAFASFTNAHKSSDKSGVDGTKSFSAFDSEFPPISELDRDDDDSDSASERGGFEDDFAPASPQATKTEAHKEATAPEPATPVVVPASVTSATEVSASDSPIPVPDHSPIAAPAPAASPAPAAPAPAAPEEPPISVGTSATITSAPAAQPAGPKPQASFDDLEDDFEGLEDAKEGSADDDFQTISRSGLDDFNAVFDSSPPPSQAKTESTAFGQESSFDFGALSPNPGTSGNNAASPKAPTAADAQDWDAIFASLDSPSDPNANTGAANATAAQEARPAPGRTLTQDGKHDDPILKNLTSMGYSREDSLLALEKYDYNLERAANYLASQS